MLWRFLHTGKGGLKHTKAESSPVSTGCLQVMVGKRWE